MVYVMELFKALLWKQWKERFRSITHGFWEVLSSLAIFLILFTAKHIHMKTRTSFGLEDVPPEVALVLYTPHNQLTARLMYPLCFEYTRTSGSSEEIDCHHMENETLLRDIMSKNQSLRTGSIIGIIFHNMSGSIFPNTLSYTLKHMDVKEPSSIPPSNYSYAYVDDMHWSHTRASKFLAQLKWTLDKSFLSIATKTPINHMIRLHDIEDYMPSEMRVAHNFIILCIVLAPLPYFLHRCAFFVVEKRTGTNEMLKLAGVPMNIIRLAQFVEICCVGIIESLLVTLVLKFLSISNEPPLISQSNFILVWITLVMHILIVTLLAFVVSTISQSHQSPDRLAILLYMFMVLIISLLYRQHLHFEPLKIIMYTFLPQAPVLLFWDEVFYLEEMSAGAHFNNMLDAKQTENVLLIWLMLFAQLFMLSALSAYLDIITPGRYGVRLKWNYFLKKSYWKTKNKRPHVYFDVTAEHEIKRDARYFEQPPFNAKNAVKVVNVTKVFQTAQARVTALNDLNLDILKNKITVILGTNGAGKTTLMSIITGLITATKGKVYVERLDNSIRIAECRRFLGYCPQHDFIFDYLTVKESILFFELIRGDPEEEREMNAKSLIKHFLLTDVANVYSSKLSYGKKRCLQIACALVGNAKILILDEPTTGMDYEMKRALWNLLLKYRGKKTILLSTSDMDEADAIGDRIAVINHGHLKCDGSPTFLKNAMETDFKIDLKLRSIDYIHKVEVALHEIFLGKSHTITIKTIMPNKMSVSIPASEREELPKVFDVLEGNKEDLGIENIHIGISMEHVFMRFIEEDDEITSYDDYQDQEYEKLKGWALRRTQLRWLIKRVFIFIIMHKIEFFVWQIAVPLFVLVAVSLTCNMQKRISNQFSPTEELVLLQTSDTLRTNEQWPLFSMFPNVHIVPSDDVKTDMNLQSKSKIGYKIYDNCTDVYYKGYLSPESMNFFSNLYMTTLPNPLRGRIEMTYSPLTKTTHHTLILPKNLYMCYTWSMWVGFVAILPLAPLILLCIHEYRRGVRFNHQMAGCPSYIMWLSKLLAHMAVYAAIVPTGVLFCTIAFDYDQTLARPKFLLALFLLLMAFGPAFLLYWYSVSFIMTPDKPIAKIYTISICFGLVTPIFVYLLTESNMAPVPRILILTVNVIGHTLPTFTFSIGLISIVTKAHHNALCRLNHHLCPNNMIDRLFMTRKMCCDSDGEPFEYFYKFYEFYLLLIQAVVFWTILILFQRRCVSRTLEFFKNMVYKAPDIGDCTTLNRVKAESEYVKKKMNQLRNEEPEARRKTQHMILIENVHKVFGCKKPIVKHVSLTCQKGQCLVILGKGNFGKSMLLQLISGYMCMTRGDCCVAGYFIKKDWDKYITELAYVRRYGLDDFLTGYSNVEMMAALHGYRTHDAKRMAMQYLRYIGLTAYTDTLFESYSPGCCTRLAMCLALLGSYKAVLFDKPFAPVDPHKRPLVTRAIHRLCDKGTACIVTETSIEWRLIGGFAHKLALLDDGKIIALGTAKEIKNELASGYTARIKLKADYAFHTAFLNLSRNFSDINRSMSLTEVNSTLMMNKYSVAAVQDEAVFELKLEFTAMFPTAVLIEENLSILKYQINDPNRTIKFSKMFSDLELLKEDYPIIEDYTLSEISILEILTQIQGHSHEEHSEVPE